MTDFGQMLRVDAKNADALGSRQEEAGRGHRRRRPHRGSARGSRVVAAAHHLRPRDPGQHRRARPGLRLRGRRADEEDGKRDVRIKMTLTAPACGMGPVLVEDVRRKLETHGRRPSRRHRAGVRSALEPRHDDRGGAAAARFHVIARRAAADAPLGTSAASRVCSRPIRPSRRQVGNARPRPRRSSPAAAAASFSSRLLFLAPLTHDRVFRSGNDASRFAQIESLVDRGERRSTARAMPTPDRVTIDGRSYSNKPPLLAVVGAGFYAVLRAFGSELRDARARGGLSAHAPARRGSHRLAGGTLRHRPRPRLSRSALGATAATVVALASATLLTSFSVTVNSHTVAAVLLFAALVGRARAAAAARRLLRGAGGGGRHRARGRSSCR